MTQANINIRMDADLKQSFERLCKEIGMNVTTAFTIFAKQSVREHKLPVSLSVDPFYCEANISELERRLADLDAGKGVVRELIEVDE